MKKKLVLSALAALMLSPLAAFASETRSAATQGPRAHVRPTLYHDRSVKLREHLVAPHK